MQQFNSFFLTLKRKKKKKYGLLAFFHYRVILRKPLSIFFLSLPLTSLSDQHPLYHRWSAKWFQHTFISPEGKGKLLPNGSPSTPLASRTMYYSILFILSHTLCSFLKSMQRKCFLGRVLVKLWEWKPGLPKLISTYFQHIYMFSFYFLTLKVPSKLVPERLHFLCISSLPLAFS